MPESGTYGSVRGAPSNGRPYRNQARCAGYPTERLRRSPVDGRMDNPCGLPTRPTTGRRLHTSSTGPHHYVGIDSGISTGDDEGPSERLVVEQLQSLAQGCKRLAVAP